MVFILEEELLMPLLLHPEMPSGALPLWGLPASTRTLSENRTLFPPFPESIHLSLSHSLESAFWDLKTQFYVFCLSQDFFFFFFRPDIFPYSRIIRKQILGHFIGYHCIQCHYISLLFKGHEAQSQLTVLVDRKEKKKKTEEWNINTLK